MSVFDMGKELFRYGAIIKDSEALTTNGWERVCVFRYEGALYWVKMRKGKFLEAEKIS